MIANEHVRTVDVWRRRVAFDALVEEISAVGACLEVTTAMWVGTRVFMVTELPAGARIAARGLVIRVELRPRGRFGVAVQFMRARLLASAEQVLPLLT